MCRYILPLWTLIWVCFHNTWHTYEVASPEVEKMKHQNKLGLLPAKIFISTKSESWKLANEAAFFFKLPSVLYLHRYDISSIIFILTYLVKSEPNFCASSTHFSTSLQNVLKTNKKLLINWDPRESVFAIFYLSLWQQYNNSL